MLVREAREEFADLLSSQSKTVDAAIAEYQRRYHRVPPRGFDKWAKLALEANCPIVDNFDTVMRSLEPFWGMTAQEVRARCMMIQTDPIAVTFVSNHTVTMPKDSLILSRFNEIIYEWTHRYREMLPDMAFTINGLAEPRVITANDRINHLVHTCAPTDEGPINGTRKPLEIMDLGKLSSWQIGTRSCPEDSPSRAIVIPEEEQRLKFIKNATLAKDWCENPNAVHKHGLFSSPYNLKITDTLVPVFSHGKPSTSQDILYPSPDYLDSYRSHKYNEKDDGPWVNKTNKMYWSGSDTGGFAIGAEWRNFHRQRFVELFSDNEKRVSLMKRARSGKWETYDEKMAQISNLADVKLTALDACTEEACDDEKEHLHIGDRDEPSKMHEYRYLFDVDGMGRTERYYKLLGSRSTVLKQTMHQEWHDDRLIPWVHYIPISLGMDELPETLRFLTQTEKGQEISKSVADAGRDWQQKALREKDMELAFLRILLEYGRLYGAERDQDSYCPDDRVRPD